MKVLYVSNACSVQEYNSLFKNISKQINHQSQKFNRLFAEGIAENGYEITMLSSRPINPAIHPQKWYKRKIEKVAGVNYIYIPFFNLKYIRQFFIIINLIKEVKRWIKENPDGVIFCDVLNYSMLCALNTATKKAKNKIISIVTDLPEILANGQMDRRAIKQNKLISESDGMVLLAEAMNEKINPLKKPYVVMEGFCDIMMKSVENNFSNKYTKKTVMYAGLLHKKYGIETLVKAFIEANIDNSYLHIYGSGDYENELVKIAKEHDSIKFFGTKDNSYIVNEELKVSLLVNPRPVNEEFVLYSFPSKNMEYLASGTPMLTTNLPTMPKDYYPYCFVAKSDDKEGLKNELVKIFSFTDQELFQFGEKAKEWVLASKNNIIQANKVMKFVTTLSDR